MSLTDLFQKKTVFSFEVFPPKATTPAEKLQATLHNLQAIHPDFISVTLGAGGTGRYGATVDIADMIQNQLGITAVSHIPGLYLSEDDVLNLLQKLAERNVHNVLALRGDRVPGREPLGVFKHADQLTTFIKQNSDFDVMGACYPYTHKDATSGVADIQHLANKVAAGADHLISQIFFDNNQFYNFREKAELAGINVPIEAGIMPVTNKRQIENITSVAGVPLPEKFTCMMERYADNKEALRDAGIAYAIDQIVDLVAQGVDGVHLYTMNNSYVAQRIWDATASLFQASATTTK
ncbi:methylenetetrahydrofolate reductase [Loigolactobacillus backii]|uniref:Methylenetetrahydrofolate reductase n=1 Tax=Loigolactobacillus backii TaxID=375175 RepID=A0A192H1D7_9LACO|nr:methylenetetrahydrofolate reductase [Loigolactobacillus backii]ANK60445.1 5,10-methylenetetrahydrofolate reductase [Loigolactobacillus backii]ANK62057.1 5,10-methylenetetrahydrofolate reductase [Loigolactobacillus backii]ANK65324.1 5,10-methylenetetrahydrofolate reductase [Loigolactobacillus backii]ANK67875.1 5,10-methylenetetrahydrofolate reductase [Loigolactobacillus backii]ANK68749.1 5,10-methylenetetrahydrofolate reductase [Loigolactobacillus backii]